MKTVKMMGCSHCPYADLHLNKVDEVYEIVKGDGDKDAEVIYIAENPGHTELVEGRPLSPHGATGRHVRMAGEKSGRKVWYTNARRCKTPSKEKPEEMRRSLEVCVREYLQPEVDAVCAFARAEGRRVDIVVIGNKAMMAVTGMKDVQRWQGSTFTRDEVIALQEVHGEAVPEDRDAVQEGRDDGQVGGTTVA